MESTAIKTPYRKSIPVVYCKGNHYEVGFEVGRTFESIIKSFLLLSGPLNNDFLPIYNTPEGKRAYDETLESVNLSFPQYVSELQGTADGAKVDFYKLFLLHMDDILSAAVTSQNLSDAPTGCSTICVNNSSTKIIGHTEDALSEVLHHFYIVSAHIISDKPEGKYYVKEERFTSLCYAGHLPGYTMNYNHHGLVFTVNTLNAKLLRKGKTPRHFITRALLSADNFEMARIIIEDNGVGAANGCSLNMTFLTDIGNLIYNVEIGPTRENELKSELNVVTSRMGDHLYHANKYLHLPTQEITGMMTDSSEERMSTFNSYSIPYTRTDVIQMLGDQSNKTHHVFRDNQENNEEAHCVKTIAVGIFDCLARTWSIYVDNPRNNEPLVILPLILKDF